MNGTGPLQCRITEHLLAGTGDRNHYNVGLQNIAVEGTNVTTAASFDLSTTGGVIFDSGTTLTYLVQPAYEEFISGVGACVAAAVCLFCT